MKKESVQYIVDRYNEIGFNLRISAIAGSAIVLYDYNGGFGKTWYSESWPDLFRDFMTIADSDSVDELIYMEPGVV